MSKNKTRQTIGKMSNSRMMWSINPTTRVKNGKKKYRNRKEEKQYLKSEKWEDSF